MLPSTVLALLLLATGANALCQKTCISDAQCKGFTQVSELRYCVQGCCSSYNTAVSVLTLNSTNCFGVIEKYTNLDANQYPWMAFVAQSNPNGGCTRICMGTLISPDWVLTDQDCGNRFGGTVDTIVYFYFDDPYNRQVYRAVQAAGTAVDIRYLKVQYIGGGTPLVIPPVPIKCDPIYPATGTSIFWSIADDADKTRTFTTVEHLIEPQEECMSELRIVPTLGATTYPNYYCTNDQSEYRTTGAPFLTRDAAGGFQLIGEVGYAYFTGKTMLPTYVQRVSSDVAQMQAITGAVCA